MNVSLNFRPSGALSKVRVTGRFLRLAKFEHEWDLDAPDPERLLSELRGGLLKADLLTFMQRLPESRPKFNYYFEWDNVAALPIKTYDHWLEKQIHRNPRNKLSKAKKLGLIVRPVEFDDDLILAIKQIQDEFPIRQGRPYAHYKMSLEAVKQGYETFLDRSQFLGAFHQGQMVGFLKLVFTEKYARTMGLLATLKHRDLAPMNALIAKAVEICANQQCPYLVYAKYDYGNVGSETLTDFKFHNGFEHILLPRYYVPVSLRGRIALQLCLHRGKESWAPKLLVRILRRARVAYYKRKYPLRELSAIEKVQCQESPAS